MNAVRKLRSALRDEPRQQRRAQIFHVQIEEPLCDIHVDEGYTDVMVIVHFGQAVIGHVWMPARPTISANAQWEAIAWRLGNFIWRYKLRELIQGAAPGNGAAPSAAPAPGAAVIVCTRDRPDHLRACLKTISELRTAPQEVVVVDNAPSDDASREVAAEFPVRYVCEPLPGQTRARNRGIVETTAEIVAFTDDDCALDPGWLDDLGRSFADPLTMGVTGYVGPIELDHPSQYLFEIHGGFDRHREPWVIDPAHTSPVTGAAVAGAGANMMFRRDLFYEIGLFAEDLGPGTPARAGDDKYMFYRLLEAGYRIAYDPTRVVWHRHRGDWEALRKILNEYGIAEFSYTSRLLLEHGELEALSIWRWWAQHIRSEGLRALRGKGRIPLALPYSELTGFLRGPSSALRSKRSRRDIPPIELPTRDTLAPAASPRVEVTRETPQVSVVIPSRNRSAMLQRVLEALAQQDHPGDRLEALVLLDGSSDDSAAMARSLPVPYRLRVFEHAQQGAAATRNRGAREAANPIVVFLDDDILPDAGLVAAHAGAHAEATGEHMVLGYSPPVVAGDDPWSLSLRAWWEDHFRRKTQPHHQWTFTDVLSGNVSIAPDLFLDLGGFDEQMTARREDWEFGVRLLRRGVSLSHEPAAKGWHHIQIDFAGGLRAARLEARGDVELSSRHPEAMPLLPLGRIAWTFAEHPRRTEAILRALPRTDPLVPGALRGLAVLEAIRDRRRWRKLSNRLLLRAYMLGLVDAIPDIAELREFLAPAAVAESAMKVPLSLDRPEPVHLPSPVGMVDVEITWKGRPLVNVPAVRPVEQWDWSELAERAMWSLEEPARLALAMSHITGSANGSH
jgi:glycosyltransferase involved in cell wall biosynthesis